MNTMIDDKNQTIRDEIEISINCIDVGIERFKLIAYNNLDYFIPFLLLSAGIEMLLKVLFCFDYKENNGQLPTDGVLRKFGHDLEKTLKAIISITKGNNNYQTIPNRINDLKYLESDQDFIDFFNKLSQFSKSNRYINLDFITEQKNENNFYDLIMDYKNKYWQNNTTKNDIFNQTTPNDKEIRAYFIKHYEGIILNFMKIICLLFTQEAFPNEARELSAGLIDKYL